MHRSAYRVQLPSKAYFETSLLIEAFEFRQLRQKKNNSNNKKIGSEKNEEGGGERRAKEQGQSIYKKEKKKKQREEKGRRARFGEQLPQGLGRFQAFQFTVKMIEERLNLCCEEQ